MGIYANLKRVFINKTKVKLQKSDSFTLQIRLHTPH